MSRSETEGEKLPHQRRRDAPGYMTELEWKSMISQEQEEYMRPFFHPKAYDGIKNAEEDGPRGIISSNRIKAKART